MAVPKTLNRQQFLQTAAAKNPGASYAKYLGYINKRRAPEQAQDPLAPWSQDQIDQQVRATIGTMPTVQTPGQIQGSVQGMLDPVVQKITAAIQGQAKSGVQAVQGYTSQLAGNLGRLGQQGVRDAFAPAEAATAASSAALADRVSGAGNGQADALAARLASINAPNAVDPAVAALRQAATGAGNATYATGDASLQMMLAQHGNAAAYANKLPDIARLAGGQQIAGVQGTANKNLSDQLAPVYGQIPGLVQHAQDAQQNRVDSYRGDKASLVGSLLGQNVSRATAQAGLAADTTAATAKAAPVFDSSNSRTLGYVADQFGNAIPDAAGHKRIVPGFHWDSSGNAVKDVKPAAGPKDTSAADAKAAAKSKASAIKSANSTALRIISTAAKATKTTAIDPLTGVKSSKATRPKVGSPAYYHAIHEAEAAIAPLVSAYMSPVEITRFVQRQANAYFTK